MANVEWLFIDRASPQVVSQGDLVSSEAGGMPVYEVIEVAGERLWLRDQESLQDRILPGEWVRWRRMPSQL